MTRTGSAKNYGHHLREAGFVEYNDMPPGGYQAGDVAIIQNHPRESKHGHMQMYDGSAWFSDFRQNDSWPGPGYRKNMPAFRIYRKNVDNQDVIVDK